jgi:hypothetical protein
LGGLNASQVKGILSLTFFLIIQQALEAHKPWVLFSSCVVTNQGVWPLAFFMMEEKTPFQGKVFLIRKIMN